MPLIEWACRKISSMSAVLSSADSRATSRRDSSARCSRLSSTKRALYFSMSKRRLPRSAGEDLLDHAMDVLGLERLDHEVSRPRLDGLHHQRLLAERAAHDDERALA